MNIFMFADDSSLEVPFLEHKEMLLAQAAAALCCHTGQVYQFLVCLSISTLILSLMFQDFITHLIYNQFYIAICQIPDQIMPNQKMTNSNLSMKMISFSLS